ncbi:MAG: hypothetical protein NVS2B9_00480 [Myxococcales bacterium]
MGAAARDPLQPGVPRVRPKLLERELETRDQPGQLERVVLLHLAEHLQVFRAEPVHPGGGRRIVGQHPLHLGEERHRGGRLGEEVLCAALVLDALLVAGGLAKGRDEQDLRLHAERPLALEPDRSVGVGEQAVEDHQVDAALGEHPLGSRRPAHLDEAVAPASEDGGHEAAEAGIVVDEEDRGHGPLPIGTSAWNFSRR